MDYDEHEMSDYEIRKILGRLEESRRKLRRLAVARVIELADRQGETRAAVGEVLIAGKILPFRKK